MRVVVIQTKKGLPALWERSMKSRPSDELVVGRFHALARHRTGVLNLAIGECS
jgi:hypothetical protein